MAGGALIGISASLMLLCFGRVTGISGILSGVLLPRKGDVSWRLSFVLGLLCGGVCVHILGPQADPSPPFARGMGSIAAAGVLVGIGSAMANGCTSGHAICGLSRLSPRSIVATFVFMLSEMATVAFLRVTGIHHVQ